MSQDRSPVLPDYRGACISNIVPALLHHAGAGAGWVPEIASDAEQVVLFVLDGLGWAQLQERLPLAPALASMVGGPITTVVPSTTASALTSISTGVAPGEHGIVGYRILTGGEILNVLRWSTASGDARERIVPADFQKAPTFLGSRPPVVTRAEFVGSGFTLAHLADTRLVPYRLASTLVTDAVRLADEGERFVYAYYDGIDKVGHEYGLGAHYDAELRAADRIVADLIELLPARATLLVTADHGQVHVGDRLVELGAEVTRMTAVQSGEARFRWLHAKPGMAQSLADAAAADHGDTAWVVTREQVVEEGWLGVVVTDAAFNRLGDVALVAREAVAFVEPADGGSLKLIGRHGSLTSAEMLVPLLASVGSGGRLRR